MGKKHRIKVTQNDIDKGHPRQFTKCPIAIACSRELKKPVWVGLEGIYVKGMVKTAYRLPTEAKRFIKLFDDRRTLVAPIEFTIEEIGSNT